jgi:hypothetical protein
LLVVCRLSLSFVFCLGGNGIGPGGNTDTIHDKAVT